LRGAAKCKFGSNKEKKPKKKKRCNGNAARQPHTHSPHACRSALSVPQLLEKQAGISKNSPKKTVIAPVGGTNIATSTYFIPDTQHQAPPETAKRHPAEKTSSLFERRSRTQTQ
jgi:hypothetical protein